MKLIASVFCFLAIAQEVAAKEYTLKDQSKNVLARREQAMSLRGKVGIIVASDSQRAESGNLAAALLQKAGFQVTDVSVVKNLEIKDQLQKMLANKDIVAILCIGGTGISPHDVTIEALNEVAEKEVPGYGELFRAKTYERWKNYQKELGLLSIDTRAKAVVAKDKIIYAIPGSPDGTQLAVSEVIIPGLPALLGQMKKEEN